MSDDYAAEVDMNEEANRENELQRTPFSPEVQESVYCLMDVMEAFTGICIEDPDGPPSTGEELSQYFLALYKEGKMHAAQKGGEHEFPYVISWEISPDHVCDGMATSLDLGLDLSWFVAPKWLSEKLHLHVYLREHHKLFSFMEAYDPEEAEAAELEAYFNDKEEESLLLCTLGEGPEESMHYEFVHSKIPEMALARSQYLHLLLKGMDAMEGYFYKSSDHVQKTVLAFFCHRLSDMLLELEEKPDASAEGEEQAKVSKYDLEHMDAANGLQC